MTQPAQSTSLLHSSEPLPYWGTVLLSVVLVLAAVLRYWGITFGLPHIYYPDEALVINRAVGMGSGDLNPHFFEYPALMMYILAFVYGVAFVVAFLTGIVGSVHDYALWFVKDPTFFYLIARWIVAALGVGSVWLTYLLGCRLFDWRVGLVASVLLCVFPEHCNFSHFMKLEVPQAFFIMWTLLLALRLLRQANLKTYLVTGILAGVCTALKYPGCLVFISVFTAHAIRTWREGKRWGVLFDVRLWWSGAAMVLVFLATNPFVILDFPTFWRDVTYQATVSNIVWVGNQPATLWEWIPASVTLLGGILTVAFLIGVPYYLLKRRPEHVVVLAFLIVFFFIMGGQKLHQIHWLLPMMGGVFIFAAAFLSEAVQATILPKRWQNVVTALLIALIVAEMIPRTIAQNRSMTLPDTRTLALEWIERNIPAGSVILMDRGRFIVGYNAPLLPDTETIERIYLAKESAQGGAQEPIEPLASKYFELLKEATRHAPTYRIIPLLHDSMGGQSGKRHRPLPNAFDDYVHKEGVQYVVTSSWFTDRYFAPNQTPENTRYSRPFVDFYRTIARRCQLLKQFSAVPGRIQGPTISIYKVPSQ